MLLLGAITLWVADMEHKPYTSAAKTDVLSTWRRFGFTPPSEDQHYVNKWQYFRSLYLKEHDKCEQQ